MMQDDLSRGNSALRGRMTARLRHARLRPTRQRVELGCILFAKGHRHITAEDLHAEARCRGLPRVARDGLQHFASIHRIRTSARGGDRRQPHLFRHQCERSPSLLRRRRGPTYRPRRRCRDRPAARASGRHGSHSDRASRARAPPAPLIHGSLLPPPSSTAITMCC